MECRKKVIRAIGIGGPIACSDEVGAGMGSAVSAAGTCGARA
jgi:hypothetical protein